MCCLTVRQFLLWNLLLALLRPATFRERINYLVDGRPPTEIDRPRPWDPSDYDQRPPPPPYPGRRSPTLDPQAAALPPRSPVRDVPEEDPEPGPSRRPDPRDYLGRGGPSSLPQVPEAAEEELEEEGAEEEEEGEVVPEGAAQNDSAGSGSTGQEPEEPQGAWGPLYSPPLSPPDSPPLTPPDPPRLSPSERRLRRRRRRRPRPPTLEGPWVPLPPPTLLPQEHHRPTLPEQRKALEEAFTQLRKDCYQLCIDVQSDLDTFFGKLGLDPRY
ncbi:E4 [Ailuropoda melanoleuca papillomavirus 4]|uniref:E4 n=1 Tax=Ailuropoda melanoleuca papillomavirus 4 TaxID=2016453 RepID=A0A220IGG6_9PAPI|nr:E4 [Ailuropoda melanoleuca papillomavirus 4]